MKKMLANNDLTSERRRIKELIKILQREYPEAECSLNYQSPFELLIATILAAQCTDERVNRVTPELFKRYPGPEQLARANLQELQKLIRSTGFFHSKALALRSCSQELVTRYGGKVPDKLEQLMQLRGVGRKTANVVLGNCFGIPSVAVDTHVGRLSRRLGISEYRDPAKVEKDIEKRVPREFWNVFSHLLIFHGRAVCTARNPHCPECPVARLCPKIGVGSKVSGLRSL